MHWLLMGGLLHLVQREGDWAGAQPAQAPSSYTKCTIMDSTHVTVTVKVMWIYIAPSRETSKALRHGLHILPANNTMPASTL